MARKDKPYKLYRGGRAKGPIGPPAGEQPSPGEPAITPEPLPQEPVGDPWQSPVVPAPLPDGEVAPPPLPPPEPEPARKRRWIRVVLVLLLLAILLVVVWGVLGYLAFRSGVKDANERLDSRAKRALAPQRGSLFSNPSTILLLGTDHGPGAGREGAGRSDAILLVHTDPDEHRIALLSVPRDLRVEIPGHGPDKVNAAYAIGGPTLAITTLQSVTGLEINHVAVVDFPSFGDVIDALGGVTVDVPKRIVSNRFDCPFRTPAECGRWSGWTFGRGPQTMDGRRALVYARIRENRLDPTESDVSRGSRQQEVVQAITGKAVSANGFLRLPFIGDDLVKPLATDLSAWDLIQLGWVKFRAPGRNTLHCRLGGEISDDGAFILATEENRAVISMVVGDSAPQPPSPGSGPYGPGCLAGNAS